MIGPNYLMVPRGFPDSSGGLPAMQETPEDPLENGKATHSNILA